eukprot:6475350-Pyramimonas_sp.AAC.1
MRNSSQPCTNGGEREVLAEALRDAHRVEGVRDVPATEPRVAAALRLHARERAAAGQLGAGGRLEAGVADAGVESQPLLS